MFIWNQKHICLLCAGHTAGACTRWDVGHLFGAWGLETTRGYKYKVIHVFLQDDKHQELTDTD